MIEDEKKNIKIEYELADIISEKPQEFKVGDSLVRFYPVTLAKKYLLKKHFDSLGVDKGKLKENVKHAVRFLPYTQRRTPIRTCMMPTGR